MQKIYLLLILCLGCIGASAQQTNPGDTLGTGQISAGLAISRPKAARLIFIMKAKQLQIDSIYGSQGTGFPEKRLKIKQIVHERDSMVNSLLDPRELERLDTAIEQKYGEKRKQYRATIQQRKSAEGTDSGNH